MCLTSAGVDTDDRDAGLGRLPTLIVHNVHRNSLRFESIEIGLQRRINLAELGVQRSDTRVISVALQDKNTS